VCAHSEYIFVVAGEGGDGLPCGLSEKKKDNIVGPFVMYCVPLL